MTRIIALMACIMALSGCSTWRALPSHGGGKRFDEEQRVVAGAIRQAIADMNVSELRGLKIMVAIDATAQNGGGQLNLPGVNNISAGYSKFDTDGTTNNLYTREGWNASTSITTDVSLRPTVFATDGDLKYFEAALSMKLRHLGVNFTSKNPDCILYVLVDVLGTNRSRNDSLIFWKDNLRATCEVTYYAADPKTNGLRFAARRASAESTYFEEGLLLFNNHKTGRILESITPTSMPVDSNDIQVTIKPVSAAQAETAIEPNIPQQSQFAKMRRRLEQKLSETNSYIQSGNFTAAEKNINDIRSIDPEYPGLDSVYSRLEAAKNQDSNSVK